MTTFLILAVTPALLVYFLDFTFGRPSDEKPGTNDIFFSYTFALCKWRLKRMNAWAALAGQYNDGIGKIKSAVELAQFKKSFKKIVFDTARPLFTWENAAGMCPICFHFWVHLGLNACFFIVGKNIYFLANNFCLLNYLVTFVLPFLTGHLFIRLLKKYA